jgi:hypothetical protein
MSYWNGSRWLESEVEVRPVASKPARGSWAKTIVMIVSLAALLIPLTIASASSHKGSPTLSVGCGSSCVVGGSLTVRGSGFTPSAGGQQVMLWVEYPNDYCGDAGCHGFYYNPTVADDGTFTKTFDNAVLQAGEGGVEGIQYNARTDKWVKVAYVDYATR